MKRLMTKHFPKWAEKQKKTSLSKKELVALKELAKILLGLSDGEIETSVKEGALLEVKP